MLITPGNYREEILNFPNGMFIKIDYGVMDYDFKDHLFLVLKDL